MRNKKRTYELLCCIFIYKLMKDGITIYDISIIEDKVFKALDKSIDLKGFKDDLLSAVTQAIAVAADFSDSSHQDKIDAINLLVCENNKELSLSQKELSALAFFSICMFAKIIPVSEYSKISSDITVFQNTDVFILHEEIVSLIKKHGHVTLLEKNDDDINFSFSVN